MAKNYPVSLFRPLAEVQRVHDMLEFVASGEPFKMTREQDIQLAGCLSALCWVLNHDGRFAAGFAERIARMEEQLLESGWRPKLLGEDN